ncbi:MAG: uroporphyrinogen-III C-methyltransferase [Pseudomonadota bacterium]
MIPLQGDGEGAAMGANRGKVYLIGAGPGDVELLTLKAVRALGEAQVVLVDELVNPAVLRFARPGVRVIPVGKRGGCRSTPQALIERLMVRYARRGWVVARVKGGDPFVFGRGGEELQTLARAGVEVEVVSGVTAGIAAPAALGIPVTHRDFAHGVTLVTGHARDGAEPDWEALARCGTTLVIYMGVARLASITQALLEGGLAPETPAAAIQSATLPGERAVASTLSRIAADARAAGIAAPAIVVIGRVAALARLPADAPLLQAVA